MRFKNFVPKNVEPSELSMGGYLTGEHDHGGTIMTVLISRNAIDEPKLGNELEWMGMAGAVPVSTKTMGHLHLSADVSGLCRRMDAKVVGVIEMAADHAPMLNVEVYHAYGGKSAFSAALLDTGSGRNCIVGALAKELAYKAHPCPGSGRVYGVGGGVEVRGVVEVIFRREGSPRLLKEPFLVLDDLPYDLILGRGFLAKYHVIEISTVLLPISLVDM
ncbi:hypothetical protein GQ53DRAFT_424753 [Thozetella sp. PMI_491]|nr:hypothetical protein GQ53DRAFT_424753 [Thozetella sp. PMI_491]